MTATPRTSLHTPEPWVIFVAGDTRELVIMPAMRPGEIAKITCPATPDPAADEQIHADARLVAAARDLLDFAHNVAAIDQGILDRGGEGLKAAMRGWLEDARIAIAKATGAA